MKVWPLTGCLLVPCLLLFFTGCGKKGPPFLPKAVFEAVVRDLQGEWDSGNFFLKGNVHAPGGAKEAPALIQGGRIYSSRYPIRNAPCEDCPIDYQGYHEFGPEAIQGAGFRSRAPGEMKGQISFFEVRLMGPGGVMGPPSNRVRVAVE